MAGGRALDWFNRVRSRAVGRVRRLNGDGIRPASKSSPGGESASCDSGPMARRLTKMLDRLPRLNPKVTEYGPKV